MCENSGASPALLSMGSMTPVHCQNNENVLHVETTIFPASFCQVQEVPRSWWTTWARFASMEWT